ncbi:hypothetical protein EP331_02900 [bacterium]|nr:MAG: hypothetical protein EP331_02900 [bacterium]
MYKRAQLAAIIVCSILITSCDLFSNESDKSSYFTLKIDGEEMDLSGGSSATFSTEFNSLSITSGSVLSGWGSVDIRIGSFTNAKTYEAYPGYINDYVNVEIWENSTRNKFENSSGNKTKLVIDSYKEKSFISGNSTVTLGNGSVAEIEFYITNVNKE